MYALAVFLNMRPVRYPLQLYPRKRHAFQLLQMAVTMILELRLDQPSRVADSLDHGSMDSSAAYLAHSREAEEGKRAYLGCYYISSTCVISKNDNKDYATDTKYRFALTTQRRNTILFTEYTRRCLSEVAATGRDADQLIATYVTLQQVAEEGMQIREKPEMSWSDVEARILSMIEEVEKIEKSLTNSIRDRMFCCSRCLFEN